MRLLLLDDYPSFSLVEFAEDEIPRYAILSHTWGHDGDEVTYKDIIDGTGSDKAGYDKLRFCAVQAKNDRLGYCWIDTCCIDKTNSAELTESINSMFRWYQNAIKCYVFLADVSTSISEDDRDSQLRKSRWFTRGWTLQELIAPKCVEFFSQKGERLGDRQLLEKQIHQITDIAIHALRGEPLSHFTINERTSWAANRMTKRPEDKVYSLLGIFDIHMEAIYGEGEHHASRRLLRELERYSENHQLSELFRDQLQLSSTKQPKTSLVNPIWTVPFERNSHFTGRESELTRLEEMLFGKHRTAKLAITGLGGVGKTQLVIELLHRVVDRQKHCSVIWVSTVNIESLQQSYLDVARQLGILGFEDDNADVKRLVQTHLSKESTGRWLLVFDNADDLDMWITKAGSGAQPGQRTHPLIDYLPRSKQGAIVFTTRDRKIGVKLAQQNIVDVPAMGEAAAAQLLGKCLVNPELVNDRQDTNALISQLTYLPLAIAQAAAYINENAISLADYLSLLAEQEEEVIDLLSEEFEDDGRYRDIKNPVAITWLISFDQIRRRDRLAADYLSFMACVEPKDIPQSLLPTGSSQKEEVDAIGTLTAYSFVNKRPADKCLDIHRLVHLATRNWLQKENLLAQSTEKAIVRLEKVFPNDDHENRNIWRMYLPHVHLALESNLVDKHWRIREDLLWRYGMCLLSDGRWKDAEKVTMQVVDIRRRMLGEEHRSTLTSMSILARIYRHQGRWKDAQELQLKDLEICKRIFGDDDADTIDSMESLASMYIVRGQWNEAETLLLQVLEARKRRKEPEHIKTLTAMAKLAVTYQSQGRWKEAEGLQVQVMETNLRVHGGEHPDTLSSMSKLASTYRNQGRWKENEGLVVIVMEMRKRVLGGEHPSTVSTMANLAATYRNQRRWKEAEELEVQVMETNLRVQGREHPRTLSSMASLAATYKDQGRWKEAEELEVQVMEMSLMVLGGEHPDTLSSMSSLSLTWKSMRRHTEALKLLDKCVQLRKRILGVNHPRFLSSSARLKKWRLEDEG
jgi:tetratricopeptide (TPR) repeat protein